MTNRFTGAELRIDPGTCTQVHAALRALPLATDVALGEVARMTTGFTGADLANLVNEAALLAGRGDKGEATLAGLPKVAGRSLWVTCAWRSGEKTLRPPMLFTKQAMGKGKMMATMSL